MDSWALLQGIDFWLERYQTLISAVLAIVVALLALKPTWRQVTLMEMERADRRRERLAERYKLATRLMDLIDPATWSTEAQDVPHPGSAPLSDEVQVEYRKAFEQRKRLLESKIAALRSQPLTDDEAAIIEGFIDTARKSIEGYEVDASPAKFAERKAINGVEVGASNLWFYLIDGPDRKIWHEMHLARTKLDALRGALVSEMAAPDRK